jgi:hypothetical protein
MAAKFFTGLPMDGPDPECVQGYGEAALTSLGADSGAGPVAAVPRPSVDHSHRTSPSSPRPSSPRPSSPRPSSARTPVPVTITPRRPPSHDCDESPLAGFAAP